jgi:hypothetical protein
MPKFFSKSVPKDGSPLQSRMEGERTPEKEAVSPEPVAASPIVPRNATQSPLDMFFKADKAERDRNRGMLSPEQAIRRPVPATEPRNVFQQSSNNIFLQELDGNNEEMPSPRTVPHNGRPSPVERAHSSPGTRPPPTDEEQRQAVTQSLKDLLFSNVNGQSPPQYPQTQPRPQSNGNIFNTPSPNQRSSSGPTTPAPSTDQPNHYALHYGNRNLSPMFKAARNETPTRPSNLRQELPGSVPAQAPNGQAPPPPRHVPQMDPNSFARSYLDRQAQTAKPDSFPDILYSNGGSQRGVQPGQVPSPGSGTHQQAAAANADGPFTNGVHRDKEDGSDVIKRMLNLHVNG